MSEEQRQTRELIGEEAHRIARALFWGGGLVGEKLLRVASD